MTDMRQKSPARRAHARSLVALCALLMACSGEQEAASEAPAEPQAFAFVGTVERVDTAARTLAVRNEDIPGWMMSMTMNYMLDSPAVLDSLQVGDRINATVYEGNFTTLYQVEVVEP